MYPGQHRTLLYFHGVLLVTSNYRFFHTIIYVASATLLINIPGGQNIYLVFHWLVPSSVPGIKQDERWVMSYWILTYWQAHVSTCMSGLHQPGYKFLATLMFPLSDMPWKDGQYILSRIFYLGLLSPNILALTQKGVSWAADSIFLFCQFVPY